MMRLLMLLGASMVSFNVANQSIGGIEENIIEENIIYMLHNRNGVDGKKNDDNWTGVS